jgi:hypothetical protein
LINTPNIFYGQFQYNSYYFISGWKKISIGTLKDVREEKPLLVITIIATKEIIVPFDTDLQEKLKKMVGKELSVLNLDGKHFLQEAREKEC